MTIESKALSGLIFNIQRHSTEDGPGIRTTVFLKGCPMRCPWCHNPEGMKPKPDIMWYQARCIGAKECVKGCPRQALALTSDGLIIERRLCDVCGDCERACPAAALEVIGKQRIVEEVADIVLRDRVFYETSGGGVTLTGGEPSMQAPFVAALMEILRREGVHVALDTCGGVKWRRLAPLAEAADLVLYDLKLMDGERHRLHTSIPLAVVLDNARRIAAGGTPMWIRTPVIPGYTDDDVNITEIARFVRHNLPTVERYDLLAFNNTCAAKYHRLDRPFPLAEETLLTDQKMDHLAGVARGQGLGCVHWSGMTRRQASP